MYLAQVIAVPKVLTNARVPKVPKLRHNSIWHSINVDLGESMYS